MNAEPIIYRITRKQAEKLVPMLNERDIFVEDIKSHINKDDIKRVAGVPTINGVSGVYVNEERRGLQPHNLISYNADFQKQWGNQPIYGNVIFVLGEKAYNALPDNLKIANDALATIIL
jgi:hypothetical protein